MEEDIDIEEHDVLEHPRIRTIFPDLASIKTEAPDDGYEDQSMDYVPYSDHESTNGESSAKRHSNRLILGSKPANIQIQEQHQNGQSVLIFGRKQVVIKQEIQDIEYDQEMPDDPIGDTFGQSSVLILGSKPSLPNPGQSNLHDNDEINREESEEWTEEDIKASVVLLENWGPRLESSSCYCKDCQILFPTQNTLQAHNMTAHSFLVAVENNKAIKSTAKGNKNFGTESDKGRFCNHCQKVFPDPDSLIKHLYENLSFDEKNQVVKRKESSLPTPQKSQVIKRKESSLPTPQKVLVNNTPPKVIPKTIDSKALAKLQQEIDPSRDLNFRCRICSCFFKSSKAYTIHMKENHLIDDLDTKSVPYEGKCPYCVGCVPQSSYNRHIKMTHPTHFHAKGKIIQQLLPNEPHKTTKYKCLKCQEIFTTVYASRRHRALKHPLLKNKSIFTKITTVTTAATAPSIVAKKPYKYKCLKCQQFFSTKYAASMHRKLDHPLLKRRQCIFSKIFTAPSIVAKKPVLHQKQPEKQIVPTRISDPVIASPPVPKSVLFKCKKCPLHFTSCTMALSDSCLQNPDDWICQKCNRSFRGEDKLLHQLQHHHTSVFTVYVCEGNIYGKVLIECPECGLYFCERSFYDHAITECSGGSVKCEHCSLPIHVLSIEEHNHWHQKLGLKKRDLIIVEYFKQTKNTQVGVKRKFSEDTDDTSSLKRRKLIPSSQKKVLVYYCKYCGCYMVGKRHIRLHEQARCEKLALKRQICKSCGLVYTSCTHSRLHEMYDKITIFDMNFYSVIDKKLVNPPMPNFPKCSKCLTHFRRFSAIAGHKCTDSHKTCNVCNKKFSDLAYDLHKRFHEYPQRSRHPKTMRPPSPEPSGSGSKQMQELPELIKKYEMLTEVWHILYRCETCDIIYDTYDQAVDHSQRHFNNMESYDVTVKHCRICELQFDSIRFDKHKELHACNTKITKSSFQILSFTFTDLFTPKWLDMFTTSANVPMKEILSRSIYSYNKGVKLRVVMDGPQESTLFQCAKCERNVHPASLTGHIDLCDVKGKAFACPMKTCGLQFCDLLVRDTHRLQHKLTKTFKTVLFNEEGDEEFNATLRRNNTETLTKEKFDKKSGHHYYQCVKCKCCLEFVADKRTHRCHYGSSRKRCQKCRLYFAYKVYAKHEALHETVRMNRNLNKISLFHPIPNTKAVIAQKYKSIVPQKQKVSVRLYKCDCGLHFTSTKAIELHSQSCSEDTEVSKEKCSKCNRLFDTAQLVSHLCKHHTNKVNTTFEVVPWKVDKQRDLKYVIYNCDHCDALFCDSKEWSAHKPTCGAEISCCNQCGLKFHSTLNHLLRHKNCSNLSLKDYDIVTSENKSRIVYKCPDCDVHYMSPGGVLYHMIKHDMNNVTACPHCGLNFMPIGLKNHIKSQHTIENYTRQDLIIETVEETADLKEDSKEPHSSALHKSVKAKMCKARPLNRPAGKTLANVFHELHDIYSNSLYKCHVCKIYFISPGGLKSHYNRKSHGIPTVVCDKCGYLFGTKSYPKHCEIHHLKMKLKRKDFKIKFNKDITSYYKNRKKIVVYSDGCGDNTKDEHSESMDLVYDEDLPDAGQSNLSFDTSELKIVPERHVSEEKVVGKVININNVLYKCLKCSLHFVHEKSLLCHILRTHIRRLPPPVAQTCSICHLKFTMPTLITHLDTHRENQTENFYVIKNRMLDKFRHDHLFQCNICFEHCTKLFELKAHMESVKSHHRSKSVCRVCGLLFMGRKQMSVHISAHHKDLKLRREDFTIMQYYGENQLVIVANDKDAEPEKQTEQTDDFAHIDLERYSNKIYQCAKCETNYLKDNSLHRHITTYRCKETHANCDICGLKFPTDKIAQEHIYVHHKSMGLKLEELDVVNMGDNPASGTDEDTNEEIDNKTEESGSDIDEIESNKPSANEDTEPRKSYTPEILTKQDLSFYNRNLYKCSACSLYFSQFINLKTHYAKTNTHRIRINNNKYVPCKICGLAFAAVGVNRHIYVHHDTFKLSLNDFRIITDTEVMAAIEGNDDSRENKWVFQCDKCAICFVTHKSLHRHVRYCDGTDSRYKCVNCGLYFSGIVSLKKHKSMQHEKNKYAVKDLMIVNHNFEKVNITHETANASEDDMQNNAEEELKQILDNISTLNKELYTNKLFKCNTCSTHFLTADILAWHTKYSKHDVTKISCTTCGFNFTVNDLPTHVFIHHDKMDLAAEHFEITDSHEIVNCATTDIPHVDNISEDSNDVKSVSSDKEPNIEAIEANNEDSQIVEEADESNESIHLILDDAEGVRIDDKIAPTIDDAGSIESADTNPVCKDETADENTSELDKIETEETSKDKTDATERQGTRQNAAANESDKQAYKIKLYKCGECKVCFLAQPACYKHVIKHTPLDSKDYIECKLCGFQFMIVNSLARHIAKHHKGPFRQEDVLVEEYQPNTLCHGTPKIEIYCGIDRVQSKLVSTTSEGNTSDLFDVEHDKDASKTSENSVDTLSSDNVEKMNADDIVMLD